MIPYGRHSIDQLDIDTVIDVLKGDWLTGGPLVEIFEQELSKVVHSKYAVACSNGTTALHLAMLALGIGKNDTVLVPAITFLASANAARYVGADVVFVDVDPTTGLMNSETLEEAILRHNHKKLKAVVNVHLAGQCENLESIHKVAKKHGLLIIEDAAHAIGTCYVSENGNSHPIGSNTFSDITTFSFHPVKAIAMGEGGAITTNDEKIAQNLKYLRSHGMIRDPKKCQNDLEEKGIWYYEMHDLGYNYRVSDINCALGLSQLKKLEVFKKYRLNLVHTYDQSFNNLQNIIPLRKLETSRTSWHLYIVLIEFENLGISRTKLMEKLKEKAIGTQVHYIPVYKQPYYRNLYGHISLEGAETYYKSCLSLPLYVGLNTYQQQEVVDFFKAYA